MEIHTSDKQEVNAIRWLLSAAAKDITRPVLEGIYIDGEKSATADGFRMHIVPTPEILKQFAGKIMKIFGNLSPNKIVETEEVEGTFPDYEQLIPKGTPHFRTAVDAKYLKEAAELVAGEKKNDDRKLVLTFWDPTWPFSLESSQGQAVIMPMFLEDEEKVITQATHEALKHILEQLDWIATSTSDPRKEIMSLAKGIRSNMET
jgi:hypothetical protein